MPFEVPNSQESNEAVKAKIELHFFRHGEKENDKTKDDTEIRLTESGREYVASLSDENTNIKQSVAFGSPRKRTQETAGLMMSGAQDTIEGNESLEELKSKLDAELGYGSKITTDKNLDFFLPESGEYLEEGLKAFKEGYLLKWLVEESEKRYAELGVEPGYFSYDNQARQIAQVVDKYIKVLPRWEALVTDTSKKYEAELERFLGTHQTVGECFLAKVIEFTEGIEKRDEFVKALGNAGFGFAEGFEVDIKQDENGEPTIHVLFKKDTPDDPEKNFEFEATVGRDIIDKILAPKK